MGEHVTPDRASAEPEQADPWNGHQWMQREQDRWAFCRVCGIVRRADDKNKPCKGPVHIGLRAEPEQDGEVAGLRAVAEAAQFLVGSIELGERPALVLNAASGVNRALAALDYPVDGEGLIDFARLAPARDDTSGGAS